MGVGRRPSSVTRSCTSRCATSSRSGSRSGTDESCRRPLRGALDSVAVVLAAEAEQAGEGIAVPSKASLSQRERELVVQPWLERVGVVGVKHVGAGAGPPDFAGRYDDECVAIEITRVFPSDGWGVKKEMGLAHRLRTLIVEVYREFPDGPRWHVSFEYDPLQPCPSARSSGWQAEARRALSTPGPGGTFRLLPRSQQRGYGLELVLTPTRPGGAFGHLPEHEWGLVTSSLGSAPVVELMSALPRVIAEKTGKVRARTRYRSCKQWWLVLDDDILFAPSSILTSGERETVARRVAECPEIGLWSKIVLYNRFQSTPPPDPAPGWFWTLFECSAHSPLSPSP